MFKHKSRITAAYEKINQDPLSRSRSYNTKNKMKDLEFQML